MYHRTLLKSIGIVALASILMLLIGCPASTTNPTNPGSNGSIIGTWKSVALTDNVNNIAVSVLNTDSSYFTMDSAGHWSFSESNISHNYVTSGHSVTSGNLLKLYIDATNNSNDHVGDSIYFNTTIDDVSMILDSASGSSHKYEAFIRTGLVGATVCGVTTNAANVAIANASMVFVSNGSTYTGSSNSWGFYYRAGFGAGICLISGTATGMILPVVTVTVPANAIYPVQIYGQVSAGNGSVVGSWRNVAHGGSYNGESGSSIEPDTTATLTIGGDGHFTYDRLRSSLPTHLEGRYIFATPLLRVFIDTTTDPQTHLGDSLHFTVTVDAVSMVLDSVNGSYHQYDAYVRKGLSGNTICGVTVSYVGLQIPGATVSTAIGSNTPVTTTSNVWGFFYLTGLSTGTWTTTAALSGLTFIPVNTSVSGNGIYPVMLLSTGGTSYYTISGMISNLVEAGISGVSLTGFPGSVVTNSSGNYSASVPAGWSGTVVPVLSGYTFTPSYRTYTNVSANMTNEYYSGNGGTSNTGTITGYVYNSQNSAPIQGATVMTDSGASATTNSSGAYSISGLAPRFYDLSVTATGFQSSQAILYVHAGIDTQVVYLAATGVANGRVYGYVNDSQTGTPISGATITCSTGESGTTDATGRYSFSLRAGTRLIVASRSGYVSSPATVLHVPSSDSVSQQLFSLTPTLVGTTGQLRFVLTWGDRPTDLDSHLLTPYTDYNGNGEVYYSHLGNSTSSPFATLDHDVTNSHGPETITIYQWATGTYKYYIRNYSGNFEGDTVITASSAVVSIYDQTGLIRQLNVPTTGTGTWWYVCDIDGSTHGISFINTILENSPAGTDRGKVESIEPPKRH